MCVVGYCISSVGLKRNMIWVRLTKVLVTAQAVKIVAAAETDEYHIE